MHREKPDHRAHRMVRLAKDAMCRPNTQVSLSGSGVRLEKREQGHSLEK